jgi:hypothetical protein
VRNPPVPKSTEFANFMDMRACSAPHPCPTDHCNITESSVGIGRRCGERRGTVSWHRSCQYRPYGNLEPSFASSTSTPIYSKAREPALMPTSRCCKTLNCKCSQTTSASACQSPPQNTTHIFIVGCPAPDLESPRIDLAPLRYQLLVGSVCGVWRQVAHGCPALWTSVVVRYPKADLRFYEEMLCSTLRRSGTPELYISVQGGTGHGSEGYRYFGHVVPHFQRAHTL